MKVTLACFVLIWSVLAEVGNTLKCWDCYSNATAFGEPEDQTCPENSQDTTLLTECNGDYCFSYEIKGKKLVFLSVSLFKKDILAFV